MTILLTHIKDIFQPVLLEQGVLDADSTIKWENICKGFLQYEWDPKLLYEELYRMELNNPEEVINQLDSLHDAFMSGLAEDFVLGKNIELINGLLDKENSILNKKITYYKKLKAVITKTERQRITEDLDKMSQRVEFEIAESTLETAIKKKARTDLKDKFDQWDKEMSEAPVSVTPSLINTDYQLDTYGGVESGSKVISLSWMKYAVAASVLIMAGLFYYNSLNITAISDNVIANVETSNQMVPIIGNHGMGYTYNEIEDQIEVISRDYTNRIISIKKILNKNTKTEVSVYKSELDSLKLLENTYVFDKHQLIVNLKNTQQQFRVILLDETSFYLMINNQFYPIMTSESPTKLVVENNAKTIHQLEKIIFENE